MSDKAQLFSAKVFVKNGITYVPHFRNSDVYVGPGYGSHNKNLYSESDLLSCGAKPEISMLWSRSQHGIVNATNP